MAAFRKGWRKPETLEGGGKTPDVPKPTQPPQTAKAPDTKVYRDRAQNAGRGGMSAGYQSTLLTGMKGVQNDSVAGALARGVNTVASSVYGSGRTLG